MSFKDYILIGLSFLLTVLLSGCEGESEPPKEYYKLDDDIEAIGDILGEQDIVILGESTHWSSEIAKQKTDLIDYLAEEHGFNKLFLETGDSEFNYYQESGLSVIDGEATQYQHESFEKYLDGTVDNVEVLPMDWSPYIAGYSASSVSLLEENIVEEISEHDLDLAEEFKRSEFALRDWFSKGVFQGEKVGRLEQPTNVYENIKTQTLFSELTSAAQNYIISRQENIEKYYSNITFKNGMAEYNDYREIGMSEKVLEQMDRNDKAIVWVANLHSNYDVTSIEYLSETFVEQNEDERVESFGALLRESKYSVYNVGLFYNASDDYEFYPTDYVTPRKEKDSILEGYIGNRLQEDVFIDFATSDFIEKNQYTAYWVGYHDYKMIPQEQFDGLIYMDHIKK